ncbi:MAG: hypothetical protein V7459_07090 [Oceanicoccus sp.]
MKYLLAVAGFLIGAIFFVADGTPLMDHIMALDVEKYQAQPFSKKVHWFLVDKGFYSEAVIGAVVGFIAGFWFDIKANKAEIDK